MEGQDNAEFKAWLVGQGAWATKQLAIPGRDALRERVRELGLGVASVGGVQIASAR